MTLYIVFSLIAFAILMGLFIGIAETHKTEIKPHYGIMICIVQFIWTFVMLYHANL